VLALCVYRRCCVQNSDTVTVPTEELTELGIGRWAKYHLVPKLEQAGVFRVLETGRGTIKVRLLHWPHAPRSLWFRPSPPNAYWRTYPKRLLARAPQGLWPTDPRRLTLTTLFLLLSSYFSLVTTLLRCVFQCLRLIS